MMLTIQGSVAFVTGANRGIGKAFVEALVQAGAHRIYATARSIETLQDVVAIAPDRIIPIALDVTKPDQVNAAAQTAQDVTLLINNVETAQWEMNTNYFGTLSVIRAFAPILQRHGGGAIVNMMSVVAVANAPVFSSYSASKAALSSLTQGVRAELAPHGTQVIGVFPGPVDTAMAEGVPMAKIAPIAVAQATLEAVEQGLDDVYPDPVSQSVFTAIAEPLKAVEKQFAGWMPQ
jgi:NAD(P)-dependent dehydrogenase (short-subunit alcohol dehydrogenase family)